MNNKDNVLQELLKIAAEKGYLLFDDILLCATQNDLNIKEIDSLSGALSIRGIFIFDEAPNDRIAPKTDEYDEFDDDHGDMAHINYEEIYAKAKELAPRLAPFIDEIAAIKPAQFGELLRIIPQAKEGNPYARSRLIEVHLRQSIRLALNKAERFGYDFEECVLNAQIGLMMALDKYDPTAGPFGSYSGFWIFQSISRYTNLPWTLLYVPVHAKETLLPIYSELREVVTPDTSYKNQKKHIERIMRKQRVYTDKLFADAVSVLIPPLSYEQLLDDMDPEDLDGMITNILPYEDKSTFNIPDPFDSVATSLVKESVLEVLSTLTEREQKVIRLRYGIDDGHERTLEEIGKQFDVSRERIRQIESKALRKLRHPRRAKILKELL